MGGVQGHEEGGRFREDIGGIAVNSGETGGLGGACCRSCDEDEEEESEAMRARAAICIEQCHVCSLVIVLDG